MENKQIISNNSPQSLTTYSSSPINNKKRKNNIHQIFLDSPSNKKTPLSAESYLKNHPCPKFSEISRTNSVSRKLSFIEETPIIENNVIHINFSTSFEKISKNHSFTEDCTSTEIAPEDTDPQPFNKGIFHSHPSFKNFSFESDYNCESTEDILDLLDSEGGPFVKGVERAEILAGRIFAEHNLNESDDN